MKKFIIVLILLPFIAVSQDIDKNNPAFAKKMQWFKDAKLGIFIHWGIYAVNGIAESWSFYNEQISYEDYIKQTEGFTAKNYDPEYWASLIKQSGAKYSVITAKHHDGFALWDTNYGNFNAVESSAAKRDVLTPFVKALRDNNLKVGLYFSLIDWSYPDYPQLTRTLKRYDIKKEPLRWKRFSVYYQGQLAELKDKYNPDLWWFDGDWEHSAEEWQAAKIRKMLSDGSPNVIFNSRLQGHGDYDTPEIGIPIHRPKAQYWELCMTMNDSWGYQPQDTNYKTPQQVIDIFVDCISKGGNLLLDIGPKADGTIPDEQILILKELGKWTAKHSQAIYGTLRGIPYDYFYGPTALSADSSILFVYIRDIPKDNKIVLKGITNKISKIKLVGTDEDLNYKYYNKVSWNTYPGIIYIDIPMKYVDKYYTVVAIYLDGKIKLYDN